MLFRSSNDPEGELRELTATYVARGLTPTLARQVAVQLTAYDALAAHSRDELGISSAFSARPLQAAMSSALSFAVGAALPLSVAALAPGNALAVWISAASLVSLAALGVVAARAGGAKVLASVWRVTFWGVLAMGATAAVGWLFGAAI